MEWAAAINPFSIPIPHILQFFGVTETSDELITNVYERISNVCNYDKPRHENDEAVLLDMDCPIHPQATMDSMTPKVQADIDLKKMYPKWASSSGFVTQWILRALKYKELFVAPANKRIPDYTTIYSRLVYFLSRCQAWNMGIVLLFLCQDVNASLETEEKGLSADEILAREKLITILSVCLHPSTDYRYGIGQLVDLFRSMDANGISYVKNRRVPGFQPMNLKHRSYFTYYNRNRYQPTPVPYDAGYQPARSLMA